MNTKIGFKVIDSFDISNIGIIVVLEDVDNGLSCKRILKSLAQNIFWEVESRIIISGHEEKFEIEKEENHFLKFTKSLPETDSKLYKITPIGHHKKPVTFDTLTFSKRRFRGIMKIIEIYENHLLLIDYNKNKELIPKRGVSNSAKIGNYVRHCEHQFYDLVDENGDLFKSAKQNDASKNKSTYK